MNLFGLFNKDKATTPEQQNVSLKPKSKILIAEDDQYLREFYQELLEGEGFVVETATDGKIALDLALQNKPQVILLDINMPVLDGVQVLEQLKKNNDTANIPVIVFTNAGTIDNMESAKYYHAFKFIIKSNIVPDEIISSVKAAIESTTKVE